VAKRIVKGLREESPSAAVLLVDDAYGLGKGEGEGDAVVCAGREEEALGGVERDALAAGQWWYGTVGNGY
jgi:hypothetical protein